MTLQFASISEIFGGSVLVEQVFSYPGLGQAAVSAGLGSDMPLLMAITIISALFVFGGNFIANILYGVIDPRIRRGGAEDEKQMEPQKNSGTLACYRVVFLIAVCISGLFCEDAARATDFPEKILHPA